MKIGFITLGCSKNRMDTEVMLHELVSAGYEITPEETEADVVVINTCGFIEDAKKEAIDNILDVAWLKEHRGLKGIIVTGCLVERYREAIFEEMPEVDALVGVGSIHNIVEAVRSLETKAKDKKTGKYMSFEPKDSVRLGGERVLTLPEYATYIKIIEAATGAPIAQFRIREIQKPHNRGHCSEAKSVEKPGWSFLSSLRT